MGNRKWYIEQLTAPALMHRNATNYGDHTCQMFKGENGEVQKLTYSEVYRIVRELSCGLMSLGFKKGDRAAVMCNTSPQWMWSDYSILCAAGITVCIYPTLSEKELEFILADSGTTVIFVEGPEILEKVKKVCKPSNKKVKVKHIVVMKESFEDKDKRVTDLSRLRKLGIAYRAKDKMLFEDRWRSVDFKDYMTIVYTSGTTGNPKGAVHTHFSWACAVSRDCIVVNYAGAEDGDLFLSFLPMSHTYERECGHGASMLAVVPNAYSSPKTLVEDLKLFKPTMFMSVPRIYERVYMSMREQAAKSPLKKKIFDAAIRTGIAVVESRADKDGFIDMSEGINLTAGVNPWLKLKFKFFDKLIFSKVREAFGGRFRFAFSAAGSLNADLCKTFLAMGIRITEGYGATETWNEVTVNRLNKILPGSIGKCSTSAIELRVDEENELQIKGDCLFSGYWNNPKATKEAFTEDGYYKSGDIVEVLADNYLKIVDRKKGLMVLDTGKNVPSQRIESLFSLSRFIEMVIPIGSERKYVSAIVVPNFDECIAHFEENGIDFDKNALVYDHELASVPVCVRVGKDFTENEEFRKIIEQEVQYVNRELEAYEQIKKYHVVDYKFTESTGELTPTLKVKRRVVMDKFNKEIEGLYK
ncbi:MAG TPA: long-chain fatty acid--CoA ligase [Spirochaetota bacterium]|nr:long-chain fatty acid--CoA ligase [Spirochaetota bacterium]HPJ34670.1 long-chain fatty acid--CoA ligase [Spirochaetota bacterium]